MKIRFANLIKGLRQLGDDVMVVTPCINPPKTFHGAKVLQRPAHVSSMCLMFPQSHDDPAVRLCGQSALILEAVKPTGDLQTIGC